ncbi:MAG: UvrB/UvrC motif-containing protein [Spirochaetia bacterium]|jgi:hypothetical protein|nr:UvrB/UvrC motif-containing protein [Spirochaetia bacterium]
MFKVLKKRGFTENNYGTGFKKEKRQKVSQDISSILDEWKYNEDKNVRIIYTSTGKAVLQVRELMGISQYELDGRPDGRKFDAFESFLDLVLEREREGGEKFSLSREELKVLENESRLYYHRYLLCFQLNDFGRVVRDTSHNIEICRIIDLYCGDNEIRVNILQYRPFLVKMNAISRAMISLQKNIKILARQILESAIGTLKEMPEVETSVFILEKSRSISYLESAIKQLDTGKNSVVDTLVIELERAVVMENYEKAAQLRDRIRELSKNQ